jgi:hypothetical protein
LQNMTLHKLWSMYFQKAASGESIERSGLVGGSCFLVIKNYP